MDEDQGGEGSSIPKPPTRKRRFDAVTEDEKKLAENPELEQSLSSASQKLHLPHREARKFIRQLIIDSKPYFNMANNSEDDEESNSSAAIQNLSYPIRLTRSKRRELQESHIELTDDPILSLLQSGEDASAAPSFLQAEIGEDDDDDEEYIPGTQEVDTATEDEDDLEGTEGGSTHDNSFDSSFLYSENSNLSDFLGGETVSSRTRKKLSLSEKKLEELALTCPPDLDLPPTQDTEDLDTPLDQDDIEWRKWLADLVKDPESTPANENEEEDPDFDFLSVLDQEQQDLIIDANEFDIPMKESQLLYREAVKDFPRKEGLKLPFLSDTLVLPKVAKKRQRKRLPKRFDLDNLHKTLSQQLQMHLQLCTQAYLLTATHPKLKHISDACQRLVKQVDQTRDDKFSHLPVYNLSKCVETVTEEHKFRNYKKKQVMPDHLLRIMLYSDIFMYRELLPYNFFPPTPPDRTRNSWYDSEFCLTAIGTYVLDQVRVKGSELCKFPRYEVCRIISEFLLPSKSPTSIYSKYKRLIQENASPNPIKFLRENGRLPLMPKDVNDVADSEVLPPFLQPDDDESPLPMWMQILRHNDEEKLSEEDYQELLKTYQKYSVNPKIIEEALKSAHLEQEPEKETDSVSQCAESEKRAETEECTEPAPVSEVLTTPTKPDSPDVTLCKSGSSRSSLKSVKSTPSPSKMASDKLLRNAKRKIAFSSIQNRSPIKPSVAHSDEHNISPVAAGAGSASHSVASSRECATPKRRVVRRRRNWFQQKRSYNSAVRYMDVTFSPRRTPSVSKRLVALQQDYMREVSDHLGDEKFDTFLNLLEQISASHDCSLAVIELKSLLSEKPILYENLAYIVNREVALFLGVYYRWAQFRHKLRFLNKLEFCLAGNSKLFDTIMETFATCVPDEVAMWNSLSPLLEFNPYLLDEFSLFFRTLPVPACFQPDFEEVILTEEPVEVSRSDEHDFEELVLLDEGEEDNILSSQSNPERKVYKSNAENIRMAATKHIQQSKVEQLLKKNDLSIEEALKKCKYRRRNQRGGTTSGSSQNGPRSESSRTKTPTHDENSMPGFSSGAEESNATHFKPISEWTKSEDQTILEKVKQRGQSQEVFSEISKELTERSNDEIQKRFLLLQEIYTSLHESSESSCGASCAGETSPIIS